MPRFVPDLDILEFPPTPLPRRALRSIFVDYLHTLEPPANSHLKDWTPEDAQAAIDIDRDYTQTTRLGCHLGGKVYEGRARKTGGHKTIYLAHLALIADGRKQQLMLVKRDTRTDGIVWQVSHLCHNAACFNPDHLVVEPRGMNLVNLESLRSFQPSH